MLVAIGRIGEHGITGIELLSTGFIVANNKVATAAHTIGGNDAGLCILIRSVNILSDYQDVSDSKVKVLRAKIHAIDPTSDILILTTDDGELEPICQLGSSDVSPPLSDVTLVGFPHCPDGRMILTTQMSNVGARVLIEYGRIKRKHLVLNTLTRPGQSGSPVFQGTNFKVVSAMILGTYRSPGPGVIIGNIDPSALNQTTHAISAEYVKELL